MKSKNKERIVIHAMRMATCCFILGLIVTVFAPVASGAKFRLGDFDGDGRTDYSVYHSAAGNWYVWYSRNGQMSLNNWGWVEAEPVPADFDGDGLSDFCVYHSRTGTWYVWLSSTGTMHALNWGWSGAFPVAGDFDGDGRCDLVLYHAESAIWRIIYSSTQVQQEVQWGNPGNQPVPADYDGDGKTDLAVYKNAEGAWYILKSSTGKACQYGWGWPDADPVPGDYDGDGRADIAIYDDQTGAWYIQSITTGAMIVLQLGAPGMQPVPGDYDGDGASDPAVYDPKTGLWYMRYSSTGTVGWTHWGSPDMEPTFFSCKRINVDLWYYNHNYGHDYTAPRQVPADMANVQWLHTDVSGWAQTSVLEVYFNRSHIYVDYDKANVWPDPGIGLVANPWVFVPRAGGGWYAATFEWLRPGQKSKPRYVVNSNHIKKRELEGFVPVPGEWYGFMVSGLARFTERNVYERSNIYMIQWPMPLE